MSIFDFFRKNKQRKTDSGQPAAKQITEEKRPQPEPVKDGAEEALYIGMYHGIMEYQMGFNSKKDVYFIEVHDKAGLFLIDDPLSFMPGQILVVIFALTKDEYDLRYNGAPAMDNPEINALLDELLQKRPKDRLAGTMIIDPADGKSQPLKFQPRCETMDDNAYKAYRMARAMDHLRSLDRVWVILSGVLDGSWPAVDARGYACVFDNESNAADYCRANQNVMSLTAKAFSREQFNGVVRGWYKLGIIRFRLNPSGEGIYGEIDRDTFLPDPKAGKWDYYGSDLNCLILRFLQARTSRQTAGMTAAAKTYWDALCHTLPQTLLLVPVTFEGDPDVVEDMTLHLTKGAVDLMTKRSVEKQLEISLPADKTYAAETNGGQPLALGDIGLFYGSDGYAFAEGKPGRIMYLRTVNSRDNTAMLCAFTGIAALHAVFGKKVRIGVFVWDEIIEHMGDSVNGSTGPLQGIVLNPGSLQLALQPKDIDIVNKLRNERPKVFVSKQENRAE